jgi:RNA polymerase sigma-B factor
LPPSPPPAPPVWSAAFSEPHQLPAGGVQPQDQAAAHLVDRWLWTYAQTRDPQLRERIVLAYLGLADRVARRYLHSPGVTPDDLRQVARLALLTAVDRYHPARGPSFLPYAVACIVGELKRYLRDTTWTVRVPRPLKERAVAVSQATEELAGRLGRAPTVQELAEAVRASPEQVIEAIEAARTRCHGSLDQPVGSDGDSTFAELLVDAGPAEEPEDLLVLPGLVRQLPERQRQVIQLTYVHELTQREIGARIGCSQMQVSRLLRRALERLRHQLLARDDGPDNGAAAPVAGQQPKPSRRAPQSSTTALRRPCAPLRPRRRGRPTGPSTTAGPCGQHHTRPPRRSAGPRAGGLGRRRDADRCLPCRLVGAGRQLPAGMVTHRAWHPLPGSERHAHGPPTGTSSSRRQRAAGCSSRSWPPMACRTWAASSLSR